jgi:tight adherence protein B
MIRVVFIVLSIVAALGIMLAARYARAARLRRLAQVTAFTHARPRDSAVALSLGRFLPRALARDLRLLGIHPAPREIAAIIAAYILSVALLVRFVGPMPAVAAAVSLPAVGAAMLNILANRRIGELGAMLPGFFDRVRQLLVIGNSLPTAFSRAVHGGQPRLGTFFTPVLRRLANGAGFAESIRQSAEDVSLYEMQLFSSAVATNLRFGGSLTHSLNNLVLFLRKRSSIERELRASTALIRSSAWVLACLPVLVAALIVAQNQDYARWFIADPTGRALLCYCVASQILGVIVMRSIIRTEF